ncbi:MAG: DUF1850 domain-containing protein [Xanthobacteraceae bacterium]|nr:DUF1850 domain-containing protein [Xanthobacteraceae bacterium]
MSVCFASAGFIKSLSVAAFTLAWTHSVEKIAWQEDWRVTSNGLQIVEARVKGSGAGMEPPAEARLVNGWFQWSLNRPAQTDVELANSGVAGEWNICHDDSCITLSQLFGRPVGVSVITMSACESEQAAQMAALLRDAPLCQQADLSQPDALIANCSTVAIYGEAPPQKAAALVTRGDAWHAKGERRRALDDYDAALKLDPALSAARDARKALFHEIELLGATMPLKPHDKKRGGG